MTLDNNKINYTSPKADRSTHFHRGSLCKASWMSMIAHWPWTHSVRIWLENLDKNAGVPKGHTLCIYHISKISLNMNIYICTYILIRIGMKFQHHWAMNARDFAFEKMMTVPTGIRFRAMVSVGSGWKHWKDVDNKTSNKCTLGGSSHDPKHTIWTNLSRKKSWSSESKGMILTLGFLVSTSTSLQTKPWETRIYLMDPRCDSWTSAIDPFTWRGFGSKHNQFHQSHWVLSI